MKTTRTLLSLSLLLSAAGTLRAMDPAAEAASAASADASALVTAGPSNLSEALFAKRAALEAEQVERTAFVAARRASIEREQAAYTTAATRVAQLNAALENTANEQERKATTLEEELEEIDALTAASMQALLAHAAEQKARLTTAIEKENAELSAKAATLSTELTQQQSAEIMSSAAIAERRAKIEEASREQAAIDAKLAQIAQGTDPDQTLLGKIISIFSRS